VPKSQTPTPKPFGAPLQEVAEVAAWPLGQTTPEIRQKNNSFFNKIAIPNLKGGRRGVSAFPKARKHI